MKLLEKAEITIYKEKMSIMSDNSYSLMDKGNFLTKFNVIEDFIEQIKTTPEKYIVYKYDKELNGYYTKEILIKNGMWNNSIYKLKKVERFNGVDLLIQFIENSLEICEDEKDIIFYSNILYLLENLFDYTVQFTVMDNAYFYHCLDYTNIEDNLELKYRISEEKAMKEDEFHFKKEFLESIDFWGNSIFTIKRVPIEE